MSLYDSQSNRLIMPLLVALLQAKKGLIRYIKPYNYPIIA